MSNLKTITPDLKPTGLKIALVHDYLAGYGGAERVLEALHELFPQAPIYTTVFLPGEFGPHETRIRHWPIRTSVLQKIPFKKSWLSLFRLLAPWAFGKFDFSQFDLVLVSATGAYIPNVIKTNQKTVHLCYCHTPPRYLYGYPTARNWQRYWWGKVSGSIANHFLRMIDFKSAQKVTYFIANSQETAGRIRKFYRRDSVVIYPPVKTGKFNLQNPNLATRSYFLAGGRLARAKRIDIAIRACTQLNLPLKVFGRMFAGYQEELIKLAGPTVDFLGEVDDRELPALYANCQAYLHCADQEDFGLIPVEVMASGRPVIAYRSGGVKETIVSGVTGEFFDQLGYEELMARLSKFKPEKYLAENCRKQAAKFSHEQFKRKFIEFIDDKVIRSKNLRPVDKNQPPL